VEVGIVIRTETTAFFDREVVLKAIGTAKAKALSRAGAFVRRNARSKLRKRGRPSRPGEPPRVFSDRLRDIRFAYDAASEQLVCGPVKYEQRFPGGDGRPIGGTVPGTLEKSGAVTVVDVLRNGKWRRDSRALRKFAPDAERRQRTLDIAARPFMRPALEEEAPKFPALFLNSLGRAG
jgi:hypothetical protein